MKHTVLPMFCLSVLLGMAGCNTPAARSPEAAHPAHPAPTGPVPKAPPTVPPVQAVQYQVLKESASKPGCLDAQGSARPLEVTREFLHLLGPDTLRPVLQKLQCPPPAQRRVQLQQELSDFNCETGEDGDTYGSYSSTVVSFNASGVLSLLVMDATDTGLAYPQTDNQLRTYDLATGKLCEVEKWLRPEKDLALRQLLTKYLQADSTGKEYVANSVAGEDEAQSKPYVVEEVPRLGLNEKGLYFLLGDLGAPHVIEGVDITIPYSALRAYVLPGTPLARVVAARSR